MVKETLIILSEEIMRESADRDALAALEELGADIESGLSPVEAQLSLVLGGTRGSFRESIRPEYNGRLQVAEGLTVRRRPS